MHINQLLHWLIQWIICTQVAIKWEDLAVHQRPEHIVVKAGILLHEVGVKLCDPPPAAWSHLCSGSFGCQFKSNGLKRRVLSRDTQPGGFFPLPSHRHAFFFHLILSAALCIAELRFGVVSGEREMWFLDYSYKLQKSTKTYRSNENYLVPHVYLTQKLKPKGKCCISSQLLFPLASFFIVSS